MLELSVLHLGEDELEAVRLCDLEGLDQENAGKKMGVSRGTVQRLVKSGRRTLVRTLVEGTALIIGNKQETNGAKNEHEDLHPNNG